MSMVEFRSVCKDYQGRRVIDMLSLKIIRFWLMATPSLPEQTQAAARAKGGERYEGFMQALGRRLAKGPSFIREVSLDIGSEGSTQRENEKAWAPSSDL
jgi:hypothetical protein